MSPAAAAELMNYRLDGFSLGRLAAALEDLKA
jgi:hypothetical protein